MSEQELCERCGAAIVKDDAYVIHGTHDDIDVVCASCITSEEIEEHRVTGGDWPSRQAADAADRLTRDPESDRQDAPDEDA